MCFKRWILDIWGKIECEDKSVCLIDGGKSVFLEESFLFVGRREVGRFGGRMTSLPGVIALLLVKGWCVFFVFCLEI